jgi:glycogen phosphorylase
MDKRTFRLELRPNIPPRLSRLEELATNLAYSWERETRDVFWRLDRQLFNACGKNPKLLLRRVAQQALEQAAADRDFLEDFHRALSSFDTYMSAAPWPEVGQELRQDDLVAYFCAEFGLHESLPIYSGGLGILAGDHCKAASDLGLPFVAVGLLYRQGYFRQTIDAAGRQQAHPHVSNFDELPVQPCRDAAGAELRVKVEIADRPVLLRIWLVQVGHVPLYLLDSDVEENDPAQRGITHQLYGGDADLRIQQEIVLGVGGLRALRLLGRRPRVFHMNEGHAAFLAFERIREEVAGGLDFAAALERIAAGNVFTTHTPVPAGHDRFNPGQVRWYLQGLLPQLGCSVERALALGGSEGGDAPFNMTTLALQASRFHNGVSAIHGGVARRMEQPLWPQLPADENPIRHITNGVHLHTFLAQAWKLVFHDLFRGWRNEVLNTGYWSCIDTIPHQRYVAVRQQLKRDLLQDVEQRLRRQLRRSGVSEAVIGRATTLVADHDSKALVIGFARRFATYKRATLLLTDEARLARLLNQADRPVLLLFAGKAHPRDEPGQAIIQSLVQASMKPEFLGRLIVLEGYDMLLARNLVQGCDVWLNNPEYPLEASGTSGQKAGINGVVNVSVLDGWWDEGYDGSNGFAVRPVDPELSGEPTPQEAALRRDQEESRQMLDILEHQVLPLYFGADHAGYDPAWIRISRNSMKSLIPRYTSARMVMDYLRGAYAPAARQARKLGDNGGLAARELAAWKQRVRERWGRVGLRLAREPQQTLRHGERLVLEVLAQIDGLQPQDVVVECLLGGGAEEEVFSNCLSHPFAPVGAEGSSVRYRLDLTPLPGLQHYRIRMRPVHAALSHPLEMGLLAWLQQGPAS